MVRVNKHRKKSTKKDAKPKKKKSLSKKNIDADVESVEKYEEMLAETGLTENNVAVLVDEKKEVAPPAQELPPETWHEKAVKILVGVARDIFSKVYKKKTQGVDPLKQSKLATIFERSKEKAIDKVCYIWRMEFIRRQLVSYEEFKRYFDVKDGEYLSGHKYEGNPSTTKKSSLRTTSKRKFDAIFLGGPPKENIFRSKFNAATMEIVENGMSILRKS
jgi:hypothetical protein